MLSHRFSLFSVRACSLSLASSVMDLNGGEREREREREKGHFCRMSLRFSACYCFFSNWKKRNRPLNSFVVLRRVKCKNTMMMFLSWLRETQFRIAKKQKKKKKRERSEVISYLSGRKDQNRALGKEKKIHLRGKKRFYGQSELRSGMLFFSKSIGFQRVKVASIWTF